MILVFCLEIAFDSVHYNPHREYKRVQKELIDVQVYRFELFLELGLEKCNSEHPNTGNHCFLENNEHASSKSPIIRFAKQIGVFPDQNFDRDNKIHYSDHQVYACDHNVAQPQGRV